jgi:hypothetical protein
VNKKASKHSATKIQLPWMSLVFVFAGGYMLFLQAPYATPEFKTLTLVNCGIPQKLRSIYRGGNEIVCAQGNEIVFTGGLSRVYGVLNGCIDAHHSLDLWLYRQPRAGSTYIFQAGCNAQIVLPYSDGVDAFQTSVWLNIVFSCAVLVGGTVTLAIRYRRRMQHQRAFDHG